MAGGVLVEGSFDISRTAREYLEVSEAIFNDVNALLYGGKRDGVDKKKLYAAKEMFRLAQEYPLFRRDAIREGYTLLLLREALDRRKYLDNADKDGEIGELGDLILMLPQLDSLGEVPLPVREDYGRLRDFFGNLKGLAHSVQ